MTDDDKALVKLLRGDWPEILVEKHWMMDSDAIDMQREEAAARIEAQAAEIEKLREALRDIQIEAERERGNWTHLKQVIARKARAALGETE